MTRASPWVSESPARQAPGERRDELTKQRQGSEQGSGQTPRQAAQRLVSDLPNVPNVADDFGPARLLSMHSFPYLHCELFTRLCERSTSTTTQPFEPRLVTRWEQLFHESEHIAQGIVLLDLDEAERSSSLRSLGISAHRLCTLMLRDLGEKPTALILLTRQDYTEIEDLLRAGVAALLHPRDDAELLAERVHAALRRRHVAHAARHARAAQDTADVVTPGAQTARVARSDRAEAAVLAPVPLLLPPASAAAVVP